MSAVREQYANVVGLDTHALPNTYAILSAAFGKIKDTATFPTSPPGPNGLLRGSTGAANQEGLCWPSREPTPPAPGSAGIRVPLSWAFARCTRRAASDVPDAVLGGQVGTLLGPRAESRREAVRVLLKAQDAMEH